MKSTQTRRWSTVSAFAAIALTASLLGTPSLAQAATPRAQSATPVVRALALSKPSTVTHLNTLTPAVRGLIKGSGEAAEQKAVAAYWTPARMKAAKSVEDSTTFKQLSAAKRTAAAEASVPRGPARAVAPSQAATAPRAVKAAPTVSLQTFSPNLPYYYPAARTNGKVFFTRAGLNYVCSASIVNSEGKSLVWTAGHCVVDGQIWDSNFAFVPSYSNGSAPYGTWYSRQLTTTSGWYWNRDLTQDIGASTVYRNFGYRLADYLGAQGIMWNQSANFYTCAFGYPQAYPYTGAYLTEACGNTGNAGDGTIYMYSGMTGGSSGGPWLRSFDGNWGYVNGHNDFIYNNSPVWMYSPYYGNQAASLYNAVRYQTS